MTPRFTTFLFAGLALAMPKGSAAEILPLYPLLELVVQSDLIVEASVLEDAVLPADMHRTQPVPDLYRVEAVLKGDIAIGEELLVKKHHLYGRGDPRSFDADTGYERYSISKALLFLDRDEHGDRNIILAGLRLLVTDGRVLFPTQYLAMGGYYLAPRPGVGWTETLDATRDTIGRVEAVFAMRDIAEPRARNDAIFEWIQTHRDEFGQDCRLSEPPDDEAQSTAWCSLERLPYEWILETATPEEAWRAITGLQDQEMSKRVAVGYDRPVDVDIPPRLRFAVCIARRERAVDSAGTRRHAGGTSLSRPGAAQRSQDTDSRGLHRSRRTRSDQDRCSPVDRAP